MIPRVGEAVQSGIRYTPRPGAYVILPRGSDVLLTKQWTDEPEILLPGGGIDPGEPTIPALHREVLEETGWRMGPPRRLGAFRRFVYMPEYDLWAEKICHVFVARPAYQLCDPLEAGHDALWMPATQAAQALVNPGDRMFLRNYFALS